jgi:hypothetical protein
MPEVVSGVAGLGRCPGLVLLAACPGRRAAHTPARDHAVLRSRVPAASASARCLPLFSQRIGDRRILLLPRDGRRVDMLLHSIRSMIPRRCVGFESLWSMVLACSSAKFAILSHSPSLRCLLGVPPPQSSHCRALFCPYAAAWLPRLWIGSQPRMTGSANGHPISSEALWRSPSPAASCPACDRRQS